MTGFGSAIAQRAVARGTQARRNGWRGGWLVCLVVLAATAGRARAEAPPEPPGPPMPPHAHAPHPPQDPSLLGADQLGQKLFPPELIMSHQDELGITAQQREAIVKEIEAVHSKIFPLQWQMSAAAEQLSKALDAPKVDEANAIAQADKVMGIEREIKRTHLTLLIRIRNLLNDSQRAKAAELRARAGH